MSKDRSSVTSPTHQQRPLPVVVVCGEIGSGKSSIINLLAGHAVANTISPTAHYECYRVVLEAFNCFLVDTPGIDRDQTSEIPNTLGLSTVLRDFIARSGSILLLYCIRGSRITASMKAIYDVCTSHSGVHIAAVVTHQDHVVDMEEWWRNNSTEFDKRDMKFIDHACVTTLKGYRENYDRSVRSLQDLLRKHAVSEGMPLQTPPGPSSTPNVILFGETGSGKSSVTNLLEPKQPTQVSSDATSPSRQISKHVIHILAREIHVFDTVGLEQPSGAAVSATDAISKIYRLMKQLESGISLLVYVVRGPRITKAERKNYELFYNIFCKRSVPILLVVTGMEDEDDVDAWWAKNRKEFDQEQMLFNAHACVTASKGKADRLLSDYWKSQSLLREQISLFSAGNSWKPADRVSWIEDVSVRLLNWLASASHVKVVRVFENDILEALLLATPNMDKADAAKMANKIYKQVNSDLKR